MQRIAVFSDTHADARATEAILHDVRAAGITRLWCLGDFCSGGPDPLDTYEMTMGACEAVIIGNHELFVLSGIWKRTSAPWALAAQDAALALGGERLVALVNATGLDAELPEAQLVHGSLTDPDRANTFLRDAREAQRNLQLMTRPLLCFGHTHAAACWTPHKAGRWARQEPVRLGVGHALPALGTGREHLRLLNPGAGCDRDGARWLELRLGEAARSAVWHRAAVGGHGGIFSRTPA